LFGGYSELLPQPMPGNTLAAYRYLGDAHVYRPELGWRAVYADAGAPAPTAAAQASVAFDAATGRLIVAAGWDGNTMHRYSADVFELHIDGVCGGNGASSSSASGGAAASGSAAAASSPLDAAEHAAAWAQLRAPLTLVPVPAHAGGMGLAMLIGARRAAAPGAFDTLLAQARTAAPACACSSRRAAECGCALFAPACSMCSRLRTTKTSTSSSSTWKQTCTQVRLR
jgi:hypothetical protein